MREHMARRQEEFHSNQNKENKSTQVSRERTDYIDFEEIKD
jgi:hypothetical protein